MFRPHAKTLKPIETCDMTQVPRTSGDYGILVSSFLHEFFLISLAIHEKSHRAFSMAFIDFTFTGQMHPVISSR